MIMRWRQVRDTLLAASMLGLTAIPAVHAHGGGHGAAHVARPARASGGQRAVNAQRMPTPNYNNNNAGRYRPRASASAAAHRANAHSQAQALNKSTPNSSSLTPNLAHNAQSRASLAPSRTGALSPTTSHTGTGLTPTAATAASRGGTTPNTYTYGYGQGARPYRAYGYGNGYRNRRYGSGYGYGRSQGNNRAIVGRLRSVHTSLARLDRDYQGHRVRAMHAVSMAIRQLSHNSMGNRGGSGGSMMGNNGQGQGQGRGMGMRQGGGGVNGAGGAGNRQRGNLSQAQSDSRMSQDLRILQGVNMQLGSQGNMSTQQRASGSIQRAIHELNVALTIR